MVGERTQRGGTRKDPVAAHTGQVDTVNTNKLIDQTTEEDDQEANVVSDSLASILQKAIGALGKKD